MALFSALLLSAIYIFLWVNFSTEVVGKGYSSRGGGRGYSTGGGSSRGGGGRNSNKNDSNKNKGGGQRGNSNSKSSQRNGQNKQGNRWCTPGGSNSKSGDSYHYSNRDGSYHYRNDDGSTYHKRPLSVGKYTKPSASKNKKEEVKK